MKLVCYNTKEPTVNGNTVGLDIINEECEMKLCEIGQPLVLCTRDATIQTSTVIQINELGHHIVIETHNSFYMFSK